MTVCFKLAEISLAHRSTRRVGFPAPQMSGHLILCREAPAPSGIWKTPAFFGWEGKPHGNLKKIADLTTKESHERLTSAHHYMVRLEGNKIKESSSAWVKTEDCINAYVETLKHRLLLRSTVDKIVYWQITVEWNADLFEVPRKSRVITLTPYIQLMATEK